MSFAGASLALYGRFTGTARRDLADAAAAAGASVTRDFTRASTHLVVGAGALSRIDALASRLAQARARQLPILSEARFAASLAGHAEPAPTVPIASVAAVPSELVDLLAAFDLIHVVAERCRFGDAATLRTALDLTGQGCSAAEVVAALLARRRAPAGRHRLILAPDGRPYLKWQDGITTVEGQGVLDLAETGSLEDRFEAAMAAERDGALETAARLYALCASADKRDAVAPFNLGNVMRALGRPCEAALAYRQAIARELRFAEAHYNLAGLLDDGGEGAAAEMHLRAALAADPDYGDALFNLAQLRLAHGAPEEARALFERFLASDPPADWARRARTALSLIAAHRGLR